MKKKTAVVITLIIVLIIGYLVLTRNSNSTNVRNMGTSVAEVKVPDDWKKCSYPGFEFELRYPSNWTLAVVSKSQGGGEMGPIQTTCGKIDASSILGELSFKASPVTASNATETMTLSINETKGGVSNQTIAVQQLVTTGKTTFHGRKYEIIFGSGVSVDVKTTVLETFHFASE